MLFVKILNKLRSFKLFFRERVSTNLSYLFCKVYKIELGKGCRFWKRPVFYKEVGAKIVIGNECIIRSDFDSNLVGVNRRSIISAHTNNAVISIGNNCAFSGVSLSSKVSIQIGDNVLVGANSMITDFDWHSFDPLDRDNKNKIKAKKIIIEDNVWIGAYCIILKGVKIGKNTVIGGGSVVTKDMPENSICAGNPCKVLKTLEITSQKY